jgi:hypothetical protein
MATSNEPVTTIGPSRFLAKGQLAKPSVFQAPGRLMINILASKQSIMKNFNVHSKQGTPEPVFYDDRSPAFLFF